MTYQVLLSRSAVESYDAIFQQIESKFGHAAADKFKGKVFDTLRLLSKTPLMYKATSQNPSVRKAVIHANCSFFYTISEQTVNILFFWDNRQDPFLE